MEPKTLSATALHVASLCLARYQVESLGRSRGISNAAANLGSAVHGALEMYVKQVHLQKKGSPSLKLLLDYYRMSYMQVFDVSETSGEKYLEGIEMLTRWHTRTDFSQFEVVSCETKENFKVQTSIGELPFNYIFDRLDKISEHEYQVTDYKTSAWPVSPQDLTDKIQARAYGLAAQIKYPNAERIWVSFDMLRHEGPVGIVFTRDDNIATWKFIKSMAEKIINTPDDAAPETLNTECLFCVRKQACGALKKNVNMGGIMSIKTASEAVDQRALLEFQQKAVASAIKELDVMILSQAKELDVFDFESADNKLIIGVSSQRAIDADRVENLIGSELFDKYGGKKFTIGATEKLLKGTELDAEKKKELRDLIYQSYGEPKVKVAPQQQI